MDEKLTPESPEVGEVEFNGFVAQVRAARNAGIGKFRIIVARKVPNAFMYECYAWGTLREATAFAQGVITTLAMVEEQLAEGDALPLGIGERSGEDITPEKEG